MRIWKKDLPFVELKFWKSVSRRRVFCFFAIFLAILSTFLSD